MNQSKLRGPFFVGLLLFVFHSLIFAQEPPPPSGSIDWLHLSQEKEWLSQIQYRKTWQGSWRSEASQSFFISQQGQIDPAAELMASYDLLKNNPQKPWGYIHQPAICAFPMRKAFFEKHLKIQFPDISCDEKNEWLKSFTDTQVYLTFSDAFPNNPASMFGHTFLLFTKNNPVSAKALLDYAINFSADTAEPGREKNEKSLIYMIKGLFGFYPGRYQVNKFYQLTNQYVNYDSRDLWYLKIPLTDEQRQRLLDHIWEIFTNTHFDYYFFDQNCSYRLLAALDYANPELQLINEFHYVFPIYYVSPLSTYRAVAARYQDSQEEFSPSIRRRLRNKIQSLLPEQYSKFESERVDLNNLQHENDIAVLDTLTLYFDYQKRVASSNYLPETTLQYLQKSLSRRAEIQIPSEPESNIKKPPSPLSSHFNRALWLGANTTQEKKSSILLGTRAAYHDILNQSSGYEKWSDLRALDLELSIAPEITKVQHFTIASIKSFFPIESFELKPSWIAEGGFDHFYDYYLKGGVGFSVQSKDEQSLGFIFLNPLLTMNPALNRQHALAIEAEFGFIHQFENAARFMISYRKYAGAPWTQFTDSEDSTNLLASFYLRKNLDLRLGLLRQNQINEYSFVGQFQF